MITFVGGLPRTGKTTFARSLSTDQIQDFVDLDRARWALSELLPLSGELEKPAGRGYEEWLRGIQAREDVLWKNFSDRYARAVGYDGGRALLVGVIRPEQLVNFPYPHRAVFFVDSKLSERIEKILSSDNENNWLLGWDESEIKAWVDFQEPAAGDFLPRDNRVIDVAKHGYSGAHELARNILNLQP